MEKPYRVIFLHQVISDNTSGSLGEREKSWKHKPA